MGEVEFIELLDSLRGYAKNIKNLVLDLERKIGSNKTLDEIKYNASLILCDIDEWFISKEEGLGEGL